MRNYWADASRSETLSACGLCSKPNVYIHVAEISEADQTNRKVYRETPPASQRLKRVPFHFSAFHQTKHRHLHLVIVRSGHENFYQFEESVGEPRHTTRTIITSKRAALIDSESRDLIGLSTIDLLCQKDWVRISDKKKEKKSRYSIEYQRKKKEKKKWKSAETYDEVPFVTCCFWSSLFISHLRQNVS